jgi:hypothetical protein
MVSQRLTLPIMNWLGNRTNEAWCLLGIYRTSLAHEKVNYGFTSD